MITFNKLVQDKRGKMLILVVLLTVSVAIKQTTCINLTYIVTKVQPSCIAEDRERYSAIGWIYPIPNDQHLLPNITTKFVPNIENEFNCNFSSHNKCNKIWKIKNWQNDETSSRTFQLIMDSRWEAFPTIFTTKNATEFKDRTEIPEVFNLAFSVRASENVEVLLCEGWNPYNYPCYHLTINKLEIYLRKYTSLPKEISNADKSEQSYKTYANILSADEWRNFVVSLNEDGVFSLLDVSFNRIAIEYKDKEVLKPLYILVRSKTPSLWKIHKNEFTYTKTAQISRLGPILSVASKDLCVSMFVSLCNNCAMNFIIMNNNEKIVLKEVTSSDNSESEWQFIKLKYENIFSDKLNIFVETKFIDKSLNQTEGFWAIDDVRVCHENEVKLTFFKLTEDKAEDEHISCQVVQNPKWRPKKLSYSNIKDFPEIENVTNSTSVKLSWSQEDSNNAIRYFVTYQANDICEGEPFNLRRIKSNGFLITKHNEITIDNLIPYTKYNITLSSVLHLTEKQIFLTTLESELPTPEELPNQVQIQVTDTKAYVSWQKIDCTSIYGHLLYYMKLTNNILTTTRELNIQTENFVEIDDLEPFTSYTLHIETARQFEDIQNNTNFLPMNINFTTQAGIAPGVRNLEVSSVDRDSVSLRYDLPYKPKGIPKTAQVSRCNPILFKKCKTSMFDVAPCKLWPKKYCIDVDNLISLQRHTFKISLKNDLTHIFGEEVSIDAFTNEQVPAQPTNITYKVVDCQDHLEYCHLNITWLHPYKQNGTITSFNIVLNASDDTVTESIHEVLKITNKTYSPQYEYQIKYIPYSTHYELYVQSANTQFRSPFSHIHVKTDDIGDHINQKPKLVCKNETALVFETPPVDHRLRSYALSVVVQDFDKAKKIGGDILDRKNISDHLCHNFGETWVLKTIEINNNTKNITIGAQDRALKPNTQYCVTFIVTNVYRNSTHEVVYYEKLQTPEVADIKTGSSYNHNHLYGLILLLLLIPVGFYVYRWIKRRRPKKPRTEESNKENVYESLPFEECEDNNCVTNETYDCLIHK